MAQPVARLAASITGYETQRLVVHGGADKSAAGRALAPGVSALTVSELLDELA